MQSTGTSGVVTNGFGMAKPGTEGMTGIWGAAAGLRDIVTSAAPMSYAIAAVAFLGAGLFTAVDALASFGAPGTPAPTALIAQAASGDFIALAQPSAPDGASGWLTRGFAAFGGALVLTGVGYRRRSKPVAETRRIAYDLSLIHI